MSYIKQIQPILLLSIVFGALLAVNTLSASWTNPPASPPNANTSAPLTVDSTNQEKTGALTVGGLLVGGSTYVHNKVKANEYCDRDGDNCFAARSTTTLLYDCSNPPVPSGNCGDSYKLECVGISSQSTCKYAGWSPQGCFAATYTCPAIGYIFAD